MAFDLRQAAIETRNLITENSPALSGLPIPRVQAILPASLEAYARECFADVRRRQQFKSKVTVTLASGEKDLTAYIDGTTERIHLPDLPRTTIYRESDNKAFTWVGSREQLMYGRVGGYDAPAVFLDGYILYTRNDEDGETDTLSGDVYFTVPVYPETVEDVPTTLQKDFVAYSAGFIGKMLSPVQAQKQ